MKPTQQWKRKFAKLKVNNEWNDSVILLLESEMQRLKDLQRKAEKELQRLPDGEIIWKDIKRKRYYYLSVVQEDIDEESKKCRRQRYLGDSDRKLREALIRKRHLTDLQPIWEENQKVLAQCIAQYIPTSAWPQVAHAQSPRPVKKRRGNDLPWEQEPYESNPFHPEGLIHMTQSGLRVRSKSEAIIVGILEANKIPYRYEAVLDIGGRRFYPDFTVRSPRDGAIFYWEHFGMTGDTEYIVAMEDKLRVYREAGITPWNKLITTYDRENGSLDARMIEAIIRGHFL